MKLIWILGTLFFLVAFPVALLTGNVRWLANDLALWTAALALAEAVTLAIVAGGILAWQKRREFSVSSQDGLRSA